MSEYIKLAKKGIMNIDKIFNGIGNKILDGFNILPNSHKELFERRKNICEKCPFNSEKAKTSQEWSLLFWSTLSDEDKEKIKIEDMHYSSTRVDLHCSLCACNIDLKTKCLDCKCGIEDFNKQYKTNIKELW